MTTTQQLNTSSAFTPIPMAPLTMPAFDWQEKAIKHVLTTGYGLIAYDMGTGKSIVGVGIAASAAAVNTNPILIVVPPTLLPTWEYEFSRFSPNTTVHVCSGIKPKPYPNVDVLLIGDSVIQQWVPVLIGNIGGIIVDESHRMKNRNAKRTKALSSLSTATQGIKCLLTGTPLPNGRNIELVGQVNILGQKAWDDLGGYGNFWGTFWPKSAGNGWGGGGNANVDLLHVKSKSFTLRCKREDVVKDLPTKGRNLSRTQCSDKGLKDYLTAEQNLYEYIRGLPISDEDKARKVAGAVRGEAIVLMNTLRQLSGKAKIAGVVARVHDLLSPSNSNQVELPDGTMAQPGVLIFAEHREVMDSLELKLLKYNPVTINGKTPKGQRQDMIQSFIDGESRVMIAHPLSAGVGLTLHGDGRNSHVIIAEQPWSPSTLTQSEDRLHRMGQTQPVTVEIMIADMGDTVTIDERMATALHNKHLNATTFLDGEGEELLTVQSEVFESYRNDI